MIGDPVPLKNLYISLWKWIPCQAQDDSKFRNSQTHTYWDNG